MLPRALPRARWLIPLSLVGVAAVVALLVVLLTDGSDGPADAATVVLPSTAPFVPVLESSDLAVGETRLVLSLLDRAAPPRFPPGVTFTLRYFDPVTGGVRFRADHDLEVIPVGSETFYVAAAPLDRPGQWELQVIAALPNGESQLSARLPFLVAAAPLTPAVGAAAPATPTLTTADLPLAQLSSDRAPDPLLYEISVAGALRRGRPFVVLFSSLEACIVRQLCERALDQIKRLAPAAAVSAIHVEPFRDAHGQGASAAAGALGDWHLRNDPWLFVVAADGTILARFDTVVSDADLAAALAAAAATAPAPAIARPEAARPEPAEGRADESAKNEAVVEGAEETPPPEEADASAGTARPEPVEGPAPEAAPTVDATPPEETEQSGNGLGILKREEEPLPPGLAGAFARIREHQVPVGELSQGQFLFARVEYAIPGWVDDARVALLIPHENARTVTIDEVLERFPDVTVREPGLAFENSAFATFLPAADLVLDGQPHVALLQGFARSQEEIAATFDFIGWQWSDFVPGPYRLAQPIAILFVTTEGEEFVVRTVAPP